MWRSSFLVNLEGCRLIAGNFTIKWTTSQVLFNSILSSLHASPMFWLKPSYQLLRSPPPSCSQLLWETLDIQMCCCSLEVLSMSLSNKFHIKTQTLMWYIEKCKILVWYQNIMWQYCQQNMCVVPSKLLQSECFWLWGLTLFSYF